MKEFFKVVTLQEALQMAGSFQPVGTETVPLTDATGRVLASDIVSDADLPGFRRSTMDGFAVQAASTFGASESSPALLEVIGSIDMGTEASISLGPGKAARILTGGMLPPGADAVEMVEHTEEIDSSTIEVTRTVAPEQHVVAADEDLAQGDRVVTSGCRLGAQEIGALAALGMGEVEVYKKPIVAILSSGDEVVPVESSLGPGQVRDVNSHSLSAMVEASGGEVHRLGIVRDDFDALLSVTREALTVADTVLVSGGSSVGSRDHTIGVASALPESNILIHGVAVRPGKPTILARIGDQAFWGLPGHVASAMVVFHILVRPFLECLSGEVVQGTERRRVPAKLSRNIASVHGRTDFVRVRLEERNHELWAIPILGKSGLIRTMIQADGLVEIDMNAEGLEQGEEVWVDLWQNQLHGK
ncbi:MAG: molybdopterin molybdotransferase MoeA [bacterium]|nr:molybdopterin molybdotransferase MoeA [bacterium]